MWQQGKPGIICKYFTTKFLKTEKTKEGKFYIDSGDNFRFTNLYLMTVDKLKIGCWVFEPPDIDEDTIPMIVLHSTGMNRSNIFKCLRVNDLIYHNFVIVMPDYREFGDSQGQFTSNGVNWDIDAVYIYCKTNYVNEPVFLGHSIGTGIALNYLNFRGYKNKVVLISTFMSALNIWRGKLLWKVFRILCYNAEKDAKRYFNFENIDTIMNIDPKNVIIFHGKADKHVPYEEARDMAMKRGCKLVLLDDVDHFTIMRHYEMYDQIEAFIRKDIKLKTVYR